MFKAKRNGVGSIPHAIFTAFFLNSLWYSLPKRGKITVESDYDVRGNAYEQAAIHLQDGYFIQDAVRTA